MKTWPTDPIRQHNLLIAALCDDLIDGHRSLKGGKAERVAEINLQINRGAGGSNKAPASNSNE